MKELESRGHELTILTGQPNYPAGTIFSGYSNWTKWSDIFSKSKVIRVPIFPRGRGQLFRLGINYIVFVLSASTIGLIRLRLKRFDYAIVFASSPITSAIPAIIYKYISKTPVAVWIQDLWPETVMAVGAIKNKFIYNMIGHIVKFIYKSSDLLLIQARSFTASVLEWGGTEKQIRYFPNWAEDQFISGTHSFTKSSARPIKILFAGNIGRAQSIETILLAAEKTAHNTKIEWHFYGDGTLADWLRTEIKKRELSSTVHFHGRKPIEDMPRVYAGHDVLLVTLKKDEALKLVLPSKTQSYLAFGKPIIASGDGELADTITHAKAGLVGSAEDASALADNAIKMANLSIEKLNEFGQNGQKYYQSEFSKISLISRLEKYLVENLRS